MSGSQKRSFNFHEDKLRESDISSYKGKHHSETVPTFSSRSSHFNESISPSQKSATFSPKLFKEQHVQSLMDEKPFPSRELGGGMVLKSSIPIFEGFEYGGQVTESSDIPQLSSQNHSLITSISAFGSQPRESRSERTSSLQLKSDSKSKHEKSKKHHHSHHHSNSRRRSVSSSYSRSTSISSTSSNSSRSSYSKRHHKSTKGKEKTEHKRTKKHSHHREYHHNRKRENESEDDSEIDPVLMKRLSVQIKKWIEKQAAEQ
ncbi:uncharacterized protein MONOS_6070 [Monocercomonoides exilis]|uniref:uncharacterized protein n=1 Tax=Monocercomonoides exilis TaxID=2049356 RepID=UPI00355A2649|nr:hypothetical protein MONOS_6070 [Monocercomonoides exilis]|eukprot:MONOS_6070.1-p1 / transcript=MONOS_6070.1 / gene=MONOS_6070 / organism=Monocercomonoides_exilis_PA203 / gene_product=unspecified product / transcript_product=unspecified product / location=Mono_scaffold00186:37132-37970(+) / protein_length=260 / sequence_SO=supercontig / SO=protein_coding / is_pseudo=false